MRTDETIGAASFTALALLCVCAVAQGRTVPATITVKEHLNQSYGAELVSFPFEAGKGTCIAESIQLTGPRGPVAAQLTAIQYWPGKEATFVKSARLGFIVDELKPLTTNTYTVRREVE